MNKKKKKSLMISLVLLIILVSFNGVMVVWGGEPGGNGGEGTSGSTEACTSYCYSLFGTGVRISLVDKTGARISGTKSYDIFGTPKSEKVPDYGSGNIYMYDTGNLLMKQELGGEKTFTESGKTFSTIATISSVDSEVWYLSSKVNTGLLFGINFNSNADINGEDSANVYYKGVLAYLKSSYESNPSEMLKEVGELLKKLNYNQELSSLSQEDMENLYIQFEPLVLIREMKKGSLYRIYYGTISQLANNNGDYENKKPTYAYIDALARKYAVKDYGIGIYIKEDNKPSNFNTVKPISTPSGDDWKKIKVNSDGYGVAHIWLGDYVGSNDCEFILEEVVHKNPGKYQVGTAAYDEAITAIRTGPSYKDPATGKQYEFEDANGAKYTIDKAYNDTRENFWLIKENYDKRDAEADPNKGKAQCKIREVECFSAVRFLNNNFHPTAKVGTADYDEAITKIIDGSWFYYASASEGGKTVYDYFLIDQPYPVASYQGLNKANYGDGKASCEGGPLTCESALEYIHSHSSEFGTPGSSKYHDAIAAVKSGTFKAEEKDAEGNVTKLLKIDRAYSFNMLDRANYGNGQAECKNKPEDNCGTPAIKGIDDDCETGYNYYKDSSVEKQWLECGVAYNDGGKHTSENTGHIAVETDNGGVVGNNEYCKLFCYEEVETNFPTKVTGVKAGQTFGWGQTGFRDSNVFGSVFIHKHCSNRKRTDAEGLDGDGYLYKKWENEYKANEKKLIEGYIRKGAAEEAKEHISVSTSTCCYRSGCKDSKGRPKCCIFGVTATAKASQNHTNPADGSGNWPNATTQSAAASKTSSCYLNSVTAINEAKNAVKTSLESQASSAGSAYESAKNREPELLKKIRQCTNNIKYEYKTVVDFVFEEPVNAMYGANDRSGYDYNKTLIKDPSGDDEGYNQDNVNKSTCTEKTVYSYTCSGSKLSSKCTSKEEKVLDCKQVTWDIKGTWTYQYPQPQFTWFSLKTNNHLVNEEHKADESAGDEFFYSLGYGLPTAFTLPSGVYDMAVIVTNIGDNGEIKDAPGATYNRPDGHFGPVLNDTDKGKGFEYKCTYEVDNDIFGYDCEYEGGQLTANSPEYCDKTKDKDPNGELVDVDIAYRLVGLLKEGDDVNKAFPGVDGGGRNIGDNWNKVYGNIPDILRADVYQNDRNGNPNLGMYEIFMDVGTIQKIRESNKSFGGNEYTSFDNVKCAVDGSDVNKKYCASDFISELHAGSYGNKLEGTCITNPDTQSRAADVLANGCHKSYTFGPIDWRRD